MKIRFKAQAEEGPYEFYGDLGIEEVEEILTWAILEMLRRGYMPAGMAGRALHTMMPEQVSEDTEDPIVQ